jgi:hypothetical protein
MKRMDWHWTEEEEVETFMAPLGMKKAPLMDSV